MARKIGSKGKITQRSKDIITKILEDNQDQISKDFNELSPVNRCKLYIELLRIITPRNRVVEIEDNQRTPLEEIKVTIVPPKSYDS